MTISLLAGEQDRTYIQDVESEKTDRPKVDSFFTYIQDVVLFYFLYNVLD